MHMSNEVENETVADTSLSVVITTDWAKELPAQIHWNYEQLKASLEKTLEPLKNMVLEKTDENVKFAKAKRAEINKLGKTLLDARVGTKKRVLAPFLDFEEKANALIDMCEEASAGFDEFVKAAEAEAKGKKWEDIKAYLFARMDEEMSQYGDMREKSLDAFKAFCKGNARWLNATYKMMDIQAEIDAEIARCIEAYNNIVEMYTSEYDGAYLAIAKEEIVKDFDSGRVTLLVSRKHREHERILAEEKAKMELAAKRKAAAEEAAAEAERNRLIHEAAEKAKEAARLEAERVRAEAEAEEQKRRAEEAERQLAERSKEDEKPSVPANCVCIDRDELECIKRILNRNVNRFSTYDEMATAWSNEYCGVAMKDWMFSQKKGA